MDRASCAGFLGGWTGKWPFYGQMWLWVTEVNADCSANYADSATAAFPTNFRTVQIKDGVLMINRAAWEQSYQLKKDEIWANHFQTGVNNNTVFRRVQPGGN